MEEARFSAASPWRSSPRRIGTDRKCLWRVLNGERAMRADEFVRLCAVLGLGLEGSFRPARPISGEANHLPPSHHRSLEPPPTLSE